MVIQIRQSLAGIGDALLGLTATGALQARDPATRVIYCCDSRAAPWVMLFDGYDALATSPVPGPLTYDLGAALTQELHGRRGRSWAECFAAWCGADQPRNPSPRPLTVSRYQGHVVLCPLTAGWPRREWRLDHWIALERMLIQHGLQVAVVGHDAQRLSAFSSAKIRGAPRDVASVINDAALVIGVDTGLLHLAGALNVPALVLAGPTLGREVYGNWSSVTTLEGDSLPCYGCFGIDIPIECRCYCAALNLTQPHRVLDAALGVLATSGRIARERLQHGQRRDARSGEVEPWFTEPALDEIRQWRLEDKLVLEWGGGHSTLWWARRCRRVVTVEASESWHEWLCDTVRKSGLHNVQILLRPLEVNPEEYPEPPLGIRPDIVVIDGARRLACLASALRLPRPFTLIIDNWQQRGGFQSLEAERLLCGLSGKTYADSAMLDDRFPWQTAIWAVE